MTGWKIPYQQVLDWGERRRQYDLAHPLGEHETADGYSNRPAFLEDLIVGDDFQGKRDDQVTFSQVVTACGFGVFIILLIGWALLAWATR